MRPPHGLFWYCAKCSAGLIFAVVALSLHLLALRCLLGLNRGRVFYGVGNFVILRFIFLLQRTRVAF